MASYEALLWDAIFTTVQSPAPTPTQMLFIGAVEFGSRALGVHTDDSNYDYAITLETWEVISKSKNFSCSTLNLMEYFNVIPTSGVNTLIRFDKYNNNNTEMGIVVVEHKSDLEVIRKSVEDVRALAWHELALKAFRIAEYQKALLRNGFTVKGDKVFAAKLLRYYK